MRVGISLLTLAPGRMGGSEVHARSLCRALARVGEEEYEALVTALAPDAGEGLPTRIVGSYRTGRTVPARLVSLATARVSRRLRREMGLERMDVIHFPLSAMVPPVDRPPSVVTVHDVQHLVMPRFFSPGTLAYRRLTYGWTAKRAHVIIVFTSHGAEMVVDHLGVSRSRVVVVPSGVDHARFSAPPAGTAREPFLLYPANAWPHKNHGVLFEAFALLRRERPELRLVLTGAGHDPAAAPPGVEVRGYVTQEELVELYRRAAAMVFPSLYEGFGQPLLEAMACGCPVAASGVSSIPEVCGGAARLFDPTSAEAVADAVADVLRSGETWAALGLEHAAGFSWERTARATEAVYRGLA